MTDQRTISGVKGQKDEFSANGMETYPKELNGLNRQITQLQGRYNKLTRTVDETRLEMGDMEKDLYSTISVTAGEIRTEVQNVNSNLQSQITQNANAISLSVTSSEFESEISALENKISLKVSRGTVESMIEVALDEITISAEQISLEGYTTINGGFSIDEDGNMVLKSRNCTAKMSSSYFLIQGIDHDAMIGPDVLSIGGYSVARVGSSGMVIGSSSVPMQCSTINGYNLDELEERISALEGA